MTRFIKYESFSENLSDVTSINHNNRIENIRTDNITIDFGIRNKWVIVREKTTMKQVYKEIMKNIADPNIIVVDIDAIIETMRDERLLDEILEESCDTITGTGKPITKIIKYGDIEFKNITSIDIKKEFSMIINFDRFPYKHEIIIPVKSSTKFIDKLYRQLADKKIKVVDLDKIMKEVGEG